MSESQAAAIRIAELELQLARLKAGLTSPNPNQAPSSASPAVPAFQFEERTDIPADVYGNPAGPGSRAAAPARHVAESITAGMPSISAPQPPPDPPADPRIISNLAHRFGPERFEVQQK